MLLIESAFPELRHVEAPDVHALDEILRQEHATPVTEQHLVHAYRVGACGLHFPEVLLAVDVRRLHRLLVDPLKLFPAPPDIVMPLAWQAGFAAPR